jgi:hypothetical protein
MLLLPCHAQSSHLLAHVRDRGNAESQLTWKQTSSLVAYYSNQTIPAVSVITSLDDSTRQHLDSTSEHIVYPNLAMNYSSLTDADVLLQLR